MTLTTGIERLRIRNYRVLKDVELGGLTPVTALLGPNGSGKSTLLDAVRFVYESFGGGLTAAWRRRGGLPEIRSRDSNGPVEIELRCRMDGVLFDYLLAVDEVDGAPVVAEEKLSWQPDVETPLSLVFQFRHGSGVLAHDVNAYEHVGLTGPDVLAVDALGQVASQGQIASFRHFVSQIQLSDLDVERMRVGERSSGRQARLDPNGVNLAMRVQYLQDRQPDVWAQITRSLQRYVPGFEDVLTIRLGDGSHIVQLKEKEVREPILPDNISDGTLKLLGYLVALRDPVSTLLIEEPENQVHPNLLYLLAEETRAVAESGQVVIATHSPYFVDALQSDEVWMMFKDEDGYADARRAADIPGLVAMVEAGGLLGNLWTEGYFGLGDPLLRSGRPR